MRAAIRQRESQQERLDAQDATELRDNWNAPSLADECRIAVESFA